MHAAAVALCGAGALSALAVVFLMGTNDVATIAAIGPAATSVAITAVFEVAGISISSGTIEDSLPNRAALVFRQAPASADAALSFLSVLVSTALIVGAGTAFAVPIATVHACIGALVGVALLSASSRGVSWPAVADVALSWAFSPILGGVFTVGGRYALRLAGSSHARYKLAIPVLSGFSSCVTLSLVAVSAPRWLLRQWIPGAVVAVLANLILFGTVSSVTAGFMRRNAGASVASVQIYNLTEDDETWEEEGVQSTLAPKRDDQTSGDAQWEDSAEVFVVDTAELSGVADESDVDVGDEEWAGAPFVVDERAPVFRLLLAGTTAGIAFAHGSTDIAYALAPLAAILRYYQALGDESPLAPPASGLNTSTLSTASAVSASSLSDKETNLLDGELGFPVFLVAAATVVAGLYLGGARVLSTVNNVNKRSKLSYARSFSVHLATALTLLLTKYLGRPVSIAYCIVAAQAVSSVAYLPVSERALERVHEGLDLRLLGRMVVLAALAPAVSAAVAVCIRLSLGIVFT